MLRRLFTLFFLLAVVVAKAEIRQVTEAQKQEALQLAQDFCNKLTQFCQGSRTINDQIFKLCTGRNCSVFDETLGKEATLQGYLINIQKNYPKSISYQVTGLSLQNMKIFYKPVVDISQRVGTLSGNNYDPLAQQNVIELTAAAYENAYLAFTVEQRMGTGALLRRLLVYDVNEKKISAFVTGEGTFISYLNGLNLLLDHKYQECIPHFEAATKNDRASLKEECSRYICVSSLLTGDYQKALEYIYVLKQPIYENYIRSLLSFEQEKLDDALKYALKAGDMVEIGKTPQSLASSIYLTAGIIYGIKGPTYNPIESVRYYKTSIQNNGIPAGYNLLTDWLINEDLQDIIDDDEFFDILEWTAGKGHTGAMLLAGKLYKADDQPQKGLAWLQKGAMAGDVFCMAQLGKDLIESGQKSQGCEWLRKSLQGNALELQVIAYAPLVSSTFWPQDRSDVEKLLASAGGSSAPAAHSNPSPASPVVSSTPSGTNTSTHYTPSPSSTSSSHYTPSYHGSFSGFNDPKDEIVGGFSMGYVQKQWEYKGEDGQVEHIGAFGDEDDEYIHGIQLGMRIEPQWGHGFGLNTGLFYEYYFQKSSDYGGAYAYFQEHSLYLPFDLEFRFNFSESFQLFAYGGLSFDCGLYSSVQYTDSDTDEVFEEEDDIYSDENEMKRLNWSYEFGGGIRIKSVQLQFTKTVGLRDMASKGASYTVYQNRPLMLSFSVMF